MPEEAWGEGISRINRKALGKRDRFRFHLGLDLGVTRLAVGRQAVEHLGNQAADFHEVLGEIAERATAGEEAGSAPKPRPIEAVDRKH